MHSVLIVDDNETLRRDVTAWAEALGFQAFASSSAEEASHLVDEHSIDILVCDVRFTGHGGVWLATQIRERCPRTAVIMATAPRDVEIAIASLRNEVVDYLIKPFDRPRLTEALALGREWHAAAAGLDALHHVLQDRLRNRRAVFAAALAEAQDTPEGALEGLIAMLQLHERDGRGHAVRVARLALALADELGLADEAVPTLEHGSLLHDIGKLDMPASILAKPAPLNEREWRVMRTHPQVGYDLLRNQPRFAEAAEIVLSHHEAFNGSGYPRGLGGEDIPLGARILTVADAYDSMTHPHTQRPPLPPALAVQEIERCRGSQFDPACAEALGAVLVHINEEMAS